MNTLKIICFLYNNSSPYKYWTKLIENRIINDPLLVPLNCGANRELINDLSNIKNLKNDNTGDNIADLNLYVGEMTGMYWAWKHYLEIGNPEYIGTCHYRRFYYLDDILDYNRFDIISTANKNIYPYSIAQQYCMNKNHDVLLFNNLISCLSNKVQLQMMRYFLDPIQIFKLCNMFIMKRELFFKYCEFIFPLVFKAIEIVNPTKTLNNKSDEDKRVISFVIERMTSFWIDREVISRRLRHKNLFNLEFYLTKPW